MYVMWCHGHKGIFQSLLPGKHGIECEDWTDGWSWNCYKAEAEQVRARAVHAYRYLIGAWVVLRCLLQVEFPSATALPACLLALPFPLSLLVFTHSDLWKAITSH